ncbi:DUF6059 family protein [Kitasatospora sp. NPDC056327]|uniref:DUF6059 family protein n=1 Tax=Kitasatospora sp. NPDC056327 TaxID=3345785 RepID=UPI0035D9D634
MTHVPRGALPWRYRVIAALHALYRALALYGTLWSAPQHPEQVALLTRPPGPPPGHPERRPDPPPRSPPAAAPPPRRKGNP